MKIYERLETLQKNLIEKRRKLCALEVTLDGQPAKITGALNSYATVTNLQTKASYEWSWEAVEKVVNSGGNFRS